MKVKELIEVLQTMPQDVNVRVFDHLKNMHSCGGDEGSSEGVYIPEVEYIDFSEEEKEYAKEQHGVDLEPWVAIEFTNEDYEE